MDRVCRAISVLVLVVVGTAGSATATAQDVQIDEVAVLAVVTDDLAPADVQRLTEALRAEVIRASGAVVPEMEEVREKQERAHIIMLVTEDAFLHIGSLLRVDAVVVAFVRKEGDQLHLEAQLMALESGETIRRQHVEAPTVDALEDSLPHLADLLFPGPDEEEEKAPADPGSAGTLVETASPEPLRRILIGAWAGASFPLTSFPAETQRFMTFEGRSASVFDGSQESLSSSASFGLVLGYAVSAVVELSLRVGLAPQPLDGYARSGRLGTWMTIAPAVDFVVRLHESLPLSVHFLGGIGAALLLPSADSDCHAADLAALLESVDLQAQCTGASSGDASVLADGFAVFSAGLRYTVLPWLELQADVLAFNMHFGAGGASDLAAKFYGVDPSVHDPRLQVRGEAPLGVQIFYQPRLELITRF